MNNWHEWEIRPDGFIFITNIYICNQTIWEIRPLKDCIRRPPKPIPYTREKHATNNTWMTKISEKSIPMDLYL